MDSNKSNSQENQAQTNSNETQIQREQKESLRKENAQLRKTLTIFEKSVLKIGSQYLEVGGPTTRLEDKIIRLSHSYDIKADVFATPSALIVSALNRKDHLKTSLNRVKEGDIDLSALARLDHLLEQMIQKEIPLLNGYRNASLASFLDPIYNRWLVLAASFAVGFLISVLEFNNLVAALCSGGLSLVLVCVIKPLLNHLEFTRIFDVFMGALICISISSLLSQFFQIPVESTFIGPLVNLVPGLMLTTAVTELAEHNFVSGTVKLVKGVLVLLSMGTALYVGMDAIEMFGLGSAQLNLSFERAGFGSNLFINALTIFTIVIAFCIRLQTPAKYIFFASFSGLLGWFTIYLLHGNHNYVFPNFCASFVVGVSSLIFARVFRTPSQIFSVPGIISLVPGVLSASLYNYSAIGTQAGAATSESPVLKVALIVSAIVFGLISARFPFRVYRKATGNLSIPGD